ncbi:DUF2752 domain-containing protein [Congregicoccus parvus]|uniref:DUF2752 domain-containing protein n=1 Tax=Congregicoccus parvus TaxID=3081749 RepID=UPI003FA5CE29
MSTPPPLSWRARLESVARAPALVPALVLSAVAWVFVATAHALHTGRLPWSPPACGWAAATGTPCPACGGTRALAALAEFDLVGALMLNPLFAALAALVALAFPLAVVDAVANRGRATSWLAAYARGRRGLVWAAALLALNWAALLVLDRLR